MSNAPISIKVKIAAVSATLLAIVVIASGAVSLRHAVEGTRLVNHYQNALVHRIADELDSKIETRVNALSFVAKSANLALSDANRTQSWLAGQQGIHALFDNGLFLVKGENAEVIAISSPHPEIAATGEFKQAVQRTLETNSSFVTKPFTVAGEGESIVLAATPVTRGEGQAVGALVGAVPSNSPSMMGGVRDIRLGETGYLALVAHDRTILIHRDHRLEMQSEDLPVPVGVLDRAVNGFDGTVNTTDFNGDDVIASFKKLGSTGWTLMAIHPARDAYAHLYQQKRDAVLFLLFGFISSIAIVWVIMRLLMRPLDRFTEQIASINPQDDHLYPVEMDGCREIDRLAMAFNDLLDRLNEDREQRRISEKYLEFMSKFDSLTGLPNRNLLEERLGQAIAHASRNNRLCAVCLLDLDGFRPVNDTHGHEIGDSLLRETAARLQNAILGDGDTCARIGGDEFALLITDAKNKDEIDHAVRRMLFLVASPYVINDLEFRMTASIGVATYPPDSDDAETLLRYADQAMYYAKREGRNRVCFFDAQQHREIERRHQCAEDISAVLQRGEMRLWYQPKIDVRNGDMFGAEALLRWRHPERGIMTPGQFMHFPDGHDVLIDIGEWVIDEALAQMTRWAGDGLVLPVSVNISARHLLRCGFVDYLSAKLDAYPAVDPSCLEMEILETDALEDIQRVREIVLECQKLGVTFALDDFGTGYSSLTYLRHLPVNTLKIDQSFVRNMLSDADDMSLVEGIVKLSSVFGMRAVAEGVETQQHFNELIKMGCHYAQGYAIARPIPPENMREWLEQHRSRPIWQAASRENSDASKLETIDMEVVACPM